MLQPLISDSFSVCTPTGIRGKRDQLIGCSVCTHKQPSQRHGVHDAFKT